MRIAIIGGGAAGMTTAYLLNNHHHVTLFEKQPILGGNIRTLNKNVTDVDLDPTIQLDNGVIEFQQDKFVLFHKLMKKLGVRVEPIRGGSTTLYLANGQYISSPGAIRDSQLDLWERIGAYSKLLPIVFSYCTFLHRTRNPGDWQNRPIADFWSGHRWRTWQRMLLMYAYSIPYAQIDDVPAEVGAEILRQSGYGTAWTRVVGGVYSYFESMLRMFRGEIQMNAQIDAIHRTADGVLIKMLSGYTHTFDKVIFAVPPDQVLELLADPTTNELQRFAPWQANHVTTIVHTDTSFYKRYGVNFFTEFDLFEKNEGRDGGYNAYLNRLCGLTDVHTPHYSLAYNLEEWIAPKNVVHRQNHHTPRYTTEAFRSRQEIIATNGINQTYHAGAYLGNGLHEGAVSSALTVSQLLDGDTI
ncbi:MAG: NAD(P)-binding protein [Chloroflexota bacterium]